MIKVSVIIPTYNRSKYIAETLESVFNQSFKNYEIIIINDGSTDDTEKILEPYRDRIIYKKIKNQGVAFARNEGMKLARGKYIAYLDDDDLYLPWKLEVQVAILEKHPDIALTYTEFSGFDGSGYFDEWHLKTYHCSAYKHRALTYDKIFSKKYKLRETPEINAALKQCPSDWLDHYAYFGKIYEHYLLNTIVFTNSIMFRSEILTEIGLQDSRFGLFHDLEFVLRISKKYNIGFIDIPSYQLRYHPGQISLTSGITGSINAIKKQRNLLQITKHYALNDENYYHSHKEIIDKQLAMLYRAIAVPMISFKSNDTHKTKYYPKRARAYLSKCKLYNNPEYFLYFLSFMPHIIRRIGFKIINIKKRLQQSG
ncbi:MAG TPA: glycosyltransferase family 2 protein [Gammaproteobacteria bacterium]|nr:glycosyltransferase family 2 protein [Gammaproteobacteria bacterium]